MARTRKRRARTADAQPRERSLIVFVHIPKTAGTTFLTVLRDNFPNRVVSIGNVFKGSGGFDSRPRDALVLRTRHARVLAGHLPYGIHKRLPPDTRYVTFLRDPVERTLSQYHGLLRRKTPLPGDGSLEAVLADGEVIHDNLQTRMLSDSDTPLGVVDDEMLEQAKRNLSTGFAAFGITERFDESLALFKRVLGLTPVVYASGRVAARPRGAEVSEDDVGVAESYNRYDIELYRWARNAFDEIVAAETLDYALDVAALKTARGGAVPEMPAALETLDRDAVWELLVRTRSEQFANRRNRAGSVPSGDDEVREVLLSLREQLSRLSQQVHTRSPARPAAGRAAPATNRRRQRGSRAERLTARVAEIAAQRDDAAASLEAAEQRVRAIEVANGGEAPPESAQLRLEVAELAKRVEDLSTRGAQLQERLSRLNTGEDAAGAPADPSTGQ